MTRWVGFLAVGSLLLIAAGLPSETTAKRSGSMGAALTPAPAATMSAGISELLAPLAASGRLGRRSTFELTLRPSLFAPTIPGQTNVVLLDLSSADGSLPGRAVEIALTPERREWLVLPAAPRVGQVAELWIESAEGDLGRGLSVTVEATSGVEAASALLSLPVETGDPRDPQEAVALQGRLVRWLAANRPELGIDEDTEWQYVGVRPIWLIVTHYLFFSEQWELGVSSHVMVPPDDWARFYLRRRFTQAVPTLAFELPSVLGPDVFREIAPPDEVTR